MSNERLTRAVDTVIAAASQEDSVRVWRLPSFLIAHVKRWFNFLFFYSVLACEGYWHVYLDLPRCLSLNSQNKRFRSAAERRWVHWIMRAGGHSVGAEASSHVSTVMPLAYHPPPASYMFQESGLHPGCTLFLLPSCLLWCGPRGLCKADLTVFEALKPG